MRSLPSTRLAAVILLTALPSTGVVAQQPASNSTAPQVELQEILRRLQDNLWDYLGNVPSFFADEHVVSDLNQNDARTLRTTTDSTFRLMRSESVGEPPTFTESREIRLVNRRPAKSDNIQGPAIFSGAFSTGVGIVSQEMSRCFDYTLEPSALLNKQPAIPIAFALKRDVLDDPSCPGPEPQSGRAWIDPGSYHPLRVETVIPNHQDKSGRVLWTWSVDYAAVTFDSRQFWMPKTITSKAVANDASAVWSFTATYSNYHKLAVTSRIITDPNDSAEPPR